MIDIEYAEKQFEEARLSDRDMRFCWAMVGSPEFGKPGWRQQADSVARRCGITAGARRALVRVAHKAGLFAGPVAT